MTGHQHTDDALESVRKLTYADFVRFPDDGRRHELIDGEHIVTAAPNLWHQAILTRLFLEVGKFLEEQPMGDVFVGPIDCVFSMFDIVEPDLIVIAPDQRSIITKKHIRGAPAIVVEILSPSTAANDEGRKLHLYERGGVIEYWIVDPDAETVIVRRSVDKRFGRPQTLTAAHNDSLTCDLLPGLSVSLKHLFRDIRS